jgi:hypothetical protein
MVKLSEHPNANYEKILDMLDRFCELAPSVISARFDPPAAEHNVGVDALQKDSRSGEYPFTTVQPRR